MTEASTRAPGHGRTRRLGVLLAAVMMLATACYTAGAENMRRTAPDGRPWYCNAVGDGTPLSGHGNGNHVHPIYAGMTKGPLSWDDCLELSHQLDQVVRAVEDRPTRADAEARRWAPITDYIGGLGTHHVEGINFIWNRTFDLTAPPILVYGGTTGTAPLVGVAYSWDGAAGPPPPAFAGTNDWWHLHRKLCYGPDGILAGAEEISDAECAALGGHQNGLGDGVWLLHVWLMQPYEYRLDVFSSGHPCLLATGVAPQADPCWAIAHRDPALGLPDTHGH